ncbi:hypothetical protein JXO52_00830 [bacterium]|nr:hypothetical protein [bacterium]
MKHLYTAILVAFLLIMTAAAAEAVRRPAEGFILRVVSDPAGDGPREVFISGADLKQLKQTRVSVQGKPEDPVRTWTGTSLAAVLSAREVDPAAIRRLSVTASDGYMAVIEGDLLSGLGTAFCATGIEDEPVFPEKYGYMRLIFPDLPPMYWINDPVRIEVSLGTSAPAFPVLDLYFPESAPLRPLLESKRVIPLANLLAGAGADAGRFSVLAADTLLRPYESNTIIKYMVLLAEADGAYSIGGVNVPTGLKTKGIFSVTANRSVIFLKQLTAAERDIWSDLVWRKQEYGKDPARPLRLCLLKNGRTILDRRVSGSGCDVYDSAVGMIMQHPDFDCIRVTAE